MRIKVLIAMCVIMLVGFLTIGFFAFPVGLTVCGVVGLVCGLRSKDRKFTVFSSALLAVGVVWAVYALLLIGSM